MVQESQKMEALIGHVINDAPHECLRELNRNLDIVDEDITIDCTTLTNHCVCAENFEYFRKPEHMLQCLRKQKCFHCQRYRCMDKKHEIVTASTKLILITAAMGSFELFRFLHRHGCCLETKSGIFELRPLHLAIANGHFNIFCYLLAQQVDVNATIRSQGTSYSPLMMAVMYGQDDMVRHLLMCRGINLSYRNSMLQSPVLFAVQNNNLDLVNILLGAEEVLQNNHLSAQKKKIRNLHHPCAMLEALKKDNITVLKALLSNGCQADFVFSGYHTQTTALVLAAVCNSFKCLELLVDHGADTEVEVNGFTALDWSEQLDWTECSKALQGAKFRNLLKGLDSDNDASGSEASDDIATSQDVTVTTDIAEHDVDHCHPNDEETECTASENISPLFAIWSFIQWIDVSEPIRRLIAKGNDVNTRDKYGRTCLHVAVEEQNVSGVRTLLQLGADAELRDVCDATPLWHAVYWNKESMIKELIFANVSLECHAREDAYRIGLPWVDIPQLDSANLEYRSALHSAVKKNFSQTVRLFLEAGYKTDKENFEELLSIAKPDVKEMLLKQSSQPQSLFNITRNYIRRKCKRKIHRLLNETDLPLRVKDCLLLRDIVDLKIEPDL
ncbi:serine/threonine-protein phosphatase 6 regulatory ankyrin repeat subunit C-like [Mercenaria mercenaria]|uniref:serine/threonine-protein phosphatase 6 regulatory ankyrin repeat subunit C-like n=1 Tax=Mercenaria mercenaria TaxID=6596 RepID=UPI001E1D7E35|nr:serine/threonine-protein phosphatase 6 regulatory ankyrin repeat subunit C-like [Mercenaria mercenaria]